MERMVFCFGMKMKLILQKKIIALLHEEENMKKLRINASKTDAAQSYPTVSWQKPVETINTNMNGTVNVFEAVKKIRQQESGYDPMIVVACSSAEYGLSLTPENTPVKEEVPLLPLHPYGVSKVG